MYQYGPDTSQADSRFDFLHFSGGGMNFASAMMYECTTLVFLFVCFSWVIPLLQSDWSLCPVTMDLIMRVEFICRRHRYHKKQKKLIMAIAPVQGHKLSQIWRFVVKSSAISFVRLRTTPFLTNKGDYDDSSSGCRPADPRLSQPPHYKPRIR